MSGVDLVVDAAVAHFDHESAVDTPGVVPGVHAKPVVHAAWNVETPTENLDGVATERGTSLV